MPLLHDSLLPLGARDAPEQQTIVLGLPLHDSPLPHGLGLGVQSAMVDGEGLHCCNMVSVFESAMDVCAGAYTR